MHVSDVSHDLVACSTKIKHENMVVKPGFFIKSSSVTTYHVDLRTSNDKLNIIR